MSENRPGFISPDAPLEMRDTSQTGEYARVYIHDGCGGGTVVGDSSLTHVCNPLRLTMGSICAGCGPVGCSSLRWEDTGEPVSAFRRRMWRKTPLICKLLPLVILPAIAGGCALALVPPGVAGDVALKAYGMIFGGAYLVIAFVLWATPLAGIVPAICGVKYHKYR